MLNNLPVRAILAVAKVVVPFLLAGALSNASAETYPSRVVKIIVGAAPGGPTDTVARIVAQELSTEWAIPVIVENKPGGSTTIATSFVAKAPPDGYTILLAFITHVTNPTLFAKLPYDPDNDFTPIVKMVEVPSLIVAHPSVPANTLQELVEQARANPGKVTFGVGSIGSAEHLTGGLLGARANVQFLAVPYQGSAPALKDLVGGLTSFKVETITNSAPFIKSGQLKPIAMTGSSRSPAFPNVPTIAESGYPKFDTTPWMGLIGPGKMPRDVVTKISGDIAKIFARPDVQQRLVAVGAVPAVLGPDPFAAMLTTQRKDYATVLKDLGLAASN